VETGILFTDPEGCLRIAVVSVSVPSATGAFSSITLFFSILGYCVTTQKFIFGCAGGLGKEIHVIAMPHGGFFHRVATIPVKSPIADIYILSDAAAPTPGENGAHRWTCTLIFTGEDRRIHLWMMHWIFSADFSSAEYRTRSPVHSRSAEN
jgi:hypothetical protein